MDFKTDNGAAGDMRAGRFLTDPDAPESAAKLRLERRQGWGYGACPDVPPLNRASEISFALGDDLGG
ncbi:hypothetical protein [uncultured Roseobacter sp.]|uniref:hypothetical protein n=1 Tax=uncultured Roseobacter sp. TaxID=114847 RepID=UPI002636EAB4|nr:hypothetical protein [uncultured Roseobacter sp.]